MAHRTHPALRGCSQNHTNVVQHLVANQNINVNHTLTTTGASPLLVASGEETVDTVKVLLDAGSNVNQVSTYQQRCSSCTVSNNCFHI